MEVIMENHSVGKTITLLRKARGWTQNELAQKLQVSDKTVSKWEQDNGFPSVEFLPALSNIFNVSIDYILTGKVEKKEIVLMSKMELSAKNDDVELFLSIPDSVIRSKDENSKDVFYYIDKYKSKKVLDALLQKYGIDSFISKYSNIYDNDEVIKLLLQFDKTAELIKISFFSYDNKKQNNISKYVGYIVDNLSTASGVIAFVIELYINDTFLAQKGWPFLYADFLKYSIQNKNDDYIRLFLHLILKINKDSIEHNKKEETKCGNNHYYEPRLAKIVKIDIDTIKGLIENKFIDEAMFLHSNCLSNPKEKLNDGEIKMLIKKTTCEISEYESIVLPCVDKMIINIDKLLECNDFNIIQKALSEYSIHEMELLAKMVINHNYRELFEYAVDNKLKINGDCIRINSDNKAYNRICEFIGGIYRQQNAYKQLPVNNKHLYVKSSYYSNELLYLVSPYKQVDLQKIVDFFDEVKKRIISSVTIRIDEEELVKSLDEKFFEEQLAKDNIDVVIIKLCVRLEAVLQYKYKFEGNFEEMLSGFCNKTLNSFMIRGRYYPPNIKNLLQKLRLQRNSLVHPNGTKITMSIDEIKTCIKFICSL